MQVTWVLALLLVTYSSADRESTALPEEFTSVIIDEGETTQSPDVNQNSSEGAYSEIPHFEESCHRLQVRRSMQVASVGDAVTLECSCTTFHAMSNPEQSCPVWRGVYNVPLILKRKIRSNSCTVTLNITRINRDIHGNIYCADPRSDKRRDVLLKVPKSGYRRTCDNHEDCEEELVCRNATCDCPPETPVYYPPMPKYPKKCYPESELSESCSHNNQCTAMDKNTYCKKVANASVGQCVCSRGFVDRHRICARRVTIVEYVYYVPKNVRIIGYVVCGLGLLLLALGTLRIFVVRKRNDNGGRLLSSCENVSTSEPEKPKQNNCSDI